VGRSETGESSRLGRFEPLRVVATGRTPTVGFMDRRLSSQSDSGVSTAIEVASAVADALLPGLGVVSKRLAENAQAELRRARSVALAAAERTSDLTREELAEAIADDPGLLPLVTRLLHAAGENDYDDTLRAMGRAFGEAVQDRDKVDDCHLVLASLADLREQHARVLRVMAKDPPLHGSKAGWTTFDVEEAAGLPSRTTSVCVAALVARGLVASEAPYIGGGAFFSITNLGRDVLAVLEEYAAEAGE
jgi:hypothetical protein